jgi:transcriptional regulator with XRE-family HTH domain
MAAEGPRVGIRELRKAHGLSVRQLCDRIAEQSGLKVHEDTIRNAELGWKRPSDALMTAWAKALGVHPLDVEVPEPKSREPLAASA